MTNQNITLGELLEGEELWEENLNMIRYDDYPKAENVKDELQYNSGWYNYSKVTFDIDGNRYSIEYKEHTSDNVCDFEWDTSSFNCLGPVAELQELITKEDLVNSTIAYEARLKAKDEEIQRYKDELLKAQEKANCLNYLSRYSNENLNGLGNSLINTYNEEDNPTDQFFRNVANVLIALSKVK